MRRKFDSDIEVACSLHRHAILEHRQQLKEMRERAVSLFEVHYDRLVTHAFTVASELGAWLGLSTKAMDVE